MLEQLAASSANTIARIETMRQAPEAELAKLRRDLSAGIDVVYGNTQDWIRRDQLDGVVVFNGRMDVTRAVTEACKSLGVPFVSLERKEDGLLLIPNANCLSLKPHHDMHEEFAERPLTKDQVAYAVRAGLSRVLQKGLREWRVYNQNSERASWPTRTSGPRVLILPSSKNEFEGHEDWKTEWDDYTRPIDDVLSILDVGAETCVLRCHPNWAEPIGRTRQAASEEHYTRWALSRGITTVPSADQRSTQDLIGEADIVLLNGSSAGIEAGMLGKRIYCIGHSRYEKTGLARHILRSSDLAKLQPSEDWSSREVIRQTLRWIYTDQRRITQYSRFVRAHSTFDFEYLEGATSEPLVHMLRTGQLLPDDHQYESTTRWEDVALDSITEGDWARWMTVAEPAPPSEEPGMSVQRRPGLRWLDAFRRILPRGDR